MTFNKPFLTNILVLSGLLFTTARMIRGTDNLYILALLSFLVIWALNYKILWDLKFQRIIIWFLPFGIWVAVSTIWSLEPLVSLSRGLFYIFISSTAVLIGFIYKKRLKELFAIFTILNAVFIVVSFISLVSGIPSDAWTANHGMGFTSIFTHQNTLAAVLMFTLIGPVYHLAENIDLVKGEKHALSEAEVVKVKSEKSTDDIKPVRDNYTYLPEWFNREAIKGSVIPVCLKPESIFYFLLLISNLYFIYLSYSRAVMLALFIGGLLFIYFIGTLKFNLIFTLAILITGAGIFVLFKPGIAEYMKKGGHDYFARRNILWIPSYKAALNGRFIGLGYGVTDPSVESNYKKENKFGELKREKGNSILAMTEETGIIGLLLFVLPICYLGKEIFNRYRISKNFFNSNFEFAIGFSFLIAFFIHAQFEAWLVGPSSLFLFVFLIISSSLFLKVVTSEQLRVNSAQNSVNSESVKRLIC